MDEVVSRRILLAKEFHLNGIDHARKKDPLSKMMAVHNFHISIEIAVKSIILKYEIRSENTLNINFEAMLNEVDKFIEFQDKGLKLPYRPEIRNLNQVRNWVQHHAMAPDESTMDDWRFFSSRFLSKVFKDYFGVNFEDVSRISFIENDELREYLECAEKEYTNKNYDSASGYAAGAFEFALLSISSFIPNSNPNPNSKFLFSIPSRLRLSGVSPKIADAFREILQRVNQAEHFTTLLASGLSLLDYKKYKDASPFVNILESGMPHFETYKGKKFTEKSSKWLIYFVTSAIVRWQQQGLAPHVFPHLVEGAMEEFRGEASVEENA